MIQEKWTFWEKIYNTINGLPASSLRSRRKVNKMFYVTAKNAKSKKMVSVECDTKEEAIIVMENLSRNSYRYKYVTIRETSPYKRGVDIKRVNRQTLPTIFRKG
jgi:glutaredoxin